MLDAAGWREGGYRGRACLYAAPSAGCLGCSGEPCIVRRWASETEPHIMSFNYSTTVNARPMEDALIIVDGQDGNSIPARIAHGMTPALFGVSRQAQRKFWEFFTAHIRNPNTRRAYLIAVWRFSDWCGHNGIPLAKVEPMVVAAYVEELTGKLAPASVKQHLAAIRMLFDWLVIGQIVPFNPASSVRGPKHIVKKGKTPVLSAEEARGLLDRIDLSTLAGLRDRALIGVLVFSFARITAAVSMRVADYYTQGKRSFFRLHEKGGRYNVVPAHHLAQEYVDAYLEAAEVGDDRRGPLFRCCAVGRQDRLENQGMSRATALRMIKRRARKAGLPAEICAHSFRGTGITEYLRNGGDLEVAARIAGHESTRTTQLYNRVQDEISLDEIERIHI